MNLRIRILACVGIISVLIAVIVLSETMNGFSHKPEYTEFTDGIATNSGVYFKENWNGMGHIYRINSLGTVLSMVHSSNLKMETIDGIDIANDSVYAIMSAERTDDVGNYRLYRIGSYTTNLELISSTEEFYIDEDKKVKRLNVSGDSMYITAISEKGDAVSVFEVTKDKLISADADKQDTKEEDEAVKTRGDYEKPASVVYRERTNDRFFVDGYYNGVDLVTRTDGDGATGEFAPDLRVKTAVDIMTFTFWQKLSLYSAQLIYVAGGLIIWFILIGLLAFALNRRDRGVYIFVITESVFLIILAASFLFIRRQYTDTALTQNTRYAVFTMKDEVARLDDIDFDGQDYFESDEYYKLMNKLDKFVSTESYASIFYDVFVMKKDSGLIVTDARGYNRENATYVYGGELSSLISALAGYEKSPAVEFDHGDEEMTAVAYAGLSPTSKYAIVTICRDMKDDAVFYEDAGKTFLTFLITFILGSLLIFLVVYMQSMDLRIFEQSIRDVALGRSNLVPPDTPAQDMKSMWKSLGELEKRIEEINYDKYRIFEAYYRFAPKKVETIMGKDSIFDVSNGDRVVVDGTLMLLVTKDSSSGEKKSKVLTNVLSYMTGNGDNRDGILVSHDSSLSVLRFLFSKDTEGCVSKTSQFIHRNLSDPGAEPVSALLYDDTFQYGVAGINTQSLSYLISEHSKELEEYAVWFGKLGIPLVITDQLSKAEDAGQTRYIGYIRLSGGTKLSLYEVIDAYPAKVRRMMLINRQNFEETIELFYSKDYYIARNRFSEILRECPEDSMAKWYLFESERYLDGGAQDSDAGRLWIDG